MIKISKNLALEMIINCKDLGSTLGKLNDRTPVNIYKREYQKDIYEIVENEETDEFFVIENSDMITIDENSEMNKALDGLKDTLTDIVTLLKEEKKGA